MLGVKTENKLNKKKTRKPASDRKIPGKPRGMQAQNDRFKKEAPGLSLKRGPGGLFLPAKKTIRIKPQLDPRGSIELPKEPLTVDSLRKVFLVVFEKMGGVEEFAKWAVWNNKNQSDFYKMLSRMLPREVVIKDNEVRPNDLSNLSEDEIDAVIADVVKGR